MTETQSSDTGNGTQPNTSAAA